MESRMIDLSRVIGVYALANTGAVLVHAIDYDGEKVLASINGGNFILWRGIPLIPTDKLLVDGLKNPKSQSGKTNILLVRTGEAKRGVIGLYQSGLQGEHSRGLSIRFRGIDDKGVASYLLSLYCSAAILADDAIAVLEDVDVGEYYDYDRN